jgi:hypothetical protein
MSFSSRQFLLIIVTIGCGLAMTAYFAPYDLRMPLMNEVVEKLTSGRVTAVWLLPGCLLGLLGDLPAIGWFLACLVVWLGNALALGSQQFRLEAVRQFWYRDELAGWPVALLFVFYLVFFALRRMYRDLDPRWESRRR